MSGVQAPSNSVAPPGPHPHRASAKIEARVLSYGLNHPTHGAQRVANHLRLEGLTVSLSGVRGSWLHHDLEPG